MPREDVNHYMNKADLFIDVMGKMNEWAEAMNDLAKRAISWNALHDAYLEERENHDRGRTDRGLNGGAWDYA